MTLIPNIIMLRYGELMTKGHNKNEFILRLHQDIKRRLRQFPEIKYVRTHDHFYLHFFDYPAEPIIEVLKTIPGLSGLSLVYQLPLDYQQIEQTVIELFKDEDNQKTFRVTTRRANKNFPLGSEEVSRRLGAIIISHYGFKVDLHKPEITLNVDIKQRNAYLYFRTIPCLGGYPLGSLSKGLMLLSGGIDSPVASYLLIKRGIRLDFIHFASPPYTSEGVILKLQDLIAQLNIYQVESKMYVIPFTKIQEEIYRHADVSYAITLMRRMMIRIATLVAKKYRIPTLATGESVGQVASQTLSSINTINEVTTYPILRPLVALDKTEIIALSRKINTYDISIRPFEDCCTIFPVINPATRPKIKVAKLYEEKFNYQELIEEAIKNIKIIRI